LGGHFIEQCVEIISGVGHISCFSIIDNNCMQQPTCPGKFLILTAFFPTMRQPKRRAGDACKRGVRDVHKGKNYFKAPDTNIGKALRPRGKSRPLRPKTS
jgi:hypothetical protein